MPGNEFDGSGEEAWSHGSSVESSYGQRASGRAPMWHADRLT
jgi:hypothetical protein